MEMSTKRGFTISRFTVFGVLQFALYMGMFAVYYWHNQADNSNPTWRMWGLAAVVCAVIVSFIPSVVHDEDGLMPPFMNVIAPVALYLLFVAGYCFYNWTVPPADDFLITFADFYLFGTVGFSVLMVIGETL